MLKAKNKIYLSSSIVILLSVVIVVFAPNPLKNKERVHAFWVKKTFGHHQADIIFLGDSRVYRGIDPESFSKQINREVSAYNMGYSSGGFSPAYLDFASKKLSKDGLKIVVLGLTPHSLTLNAAENKALDMYLNEPWFEKYKALYLSNFLQHFAPYDLKSDVFRIEENLYLEDYKYNGWVASDYSIPEHNKALAHYKKIYEQYQVDHDTENKFIKKLETLKKEGYQVFAFRVPTSIQMDRLENKFSGFKEEHLKERLNRIGIHWLSTPKNLSFKTYDGSHLQKESAIKLSEFLGKEIQKQLD